ncbi:MAG: hypothetical protein ACRYFS_07545 [Janthinobacterium lividum]
MKLYNISNAIASGLIASICFGLAGCGRQSMDLPANTPLIGVPKLGACIPEVRPTYGVYLPLCNRGPWDLKGQVQVTGDKQEVLYPISGFTAGSGSGFDVIVCEVPKKRLHPVYLRVIWQRGTTSGVVHFVVGPKEDNSISVEAKQVNPVS